MKGETGLIAAIGNPNHALSNSFNFPMHMFCRVLTTKIDPSTDARTYVNRTENNNQKLVFETENEHSPTIAFNALVTNGHSHLYHLDESTFIFRGLGSDFTFLFHFSMDFM